MTERTLAHRRYHLSEFREIFNALFRIEDRQVQSRVLNAINGIVHGECECRQNRSFVETSVQTSFEYTVPNKEINRSTESKSVQTNTFAVDSEPNAELPPASPPRLHSRSVKRDSTRVRDSAILRAKRPGSPSSCPSPVRNSSLADCHKNALSKFMETEPTETETVEIIDDSGTMAEEAEVVIECETVESPEKPTRINSKSSHSEPIYSSITIELVTDRDSSQDSTVITSITSEPDEDIVDKGQIKSQSLSGFGMSADENRRIIRKRKRKSKIPRVEKAESEHTPYQEILNEKMSTRSHKISRKETPDRRTNIRMDALLNYYTPDQIEESIFKLQSNSVDVMELMKREFLNSDKMDNGLHPIHTAILENELPALKRQIYILKYRKWNINGILTIDHESPLQLAVKNNSILQIMKELIAIGANVSELDTDSNTLIHLAMMHSESVDLLKLLLEKIDYKLIKAYNDSGNTALHIGASEDKFFMCKALLEFIDKKENLKTTGANVVNKEQLLELYKKELRKFRSLPKMKLSAAKQEILNAMNRRHGRTPLFLALGNNSEDAELMVLMFLVNFADPRVADYTGMDSLQFAAEAASEETPDRRTNIRMDALLNYYTPDQIEESIFKLQSNSVDVMELMKREFLNSDKMDNGLHPIHTAILENELPALKRQIYILKYRKWNINGILTIDHESPLQLAVKNNSILQIMKELIAIGANVSELDTDSNTLIHLAMMHSESVDLLKLLLEKIDYKLIKAYNDSGNTALHIGASEDKFFMCKALLEFIDKKENLKTTGANVVNKEQLLELYKKELRKFRSLPKMKLSAAKQEILNAMNRRHGRTPLFLALGNNSEDAELMVLMFLVNFADPRVADYTGMDSLQFAAEAASEVKASLYNDALECSLVFFENLTLLKDLNSSNV